MGKPLGEVGDLSAMFAGVDVHIISYYDHIMIILWYDMIWFSMFPIYVRPSTCRPFFTCLKGSLVKNYTGVGSVQRHQRHLNWWWLPEPLAMISTPRVQSWELIVGKTRRFLQCEAPQWCLLVNKSPSNYSYLRTINHSDIGVINQLIYRTGASHCGLYTIWYGLIWFNL